MWTDLVTPSEGGEKNETKDRVWMQNVGICRDQHWINSCLSVSGLIWEIH